MILNINYKKVISMFLAICGVYGVVCELWITSQSNNLFGEMLFLPCVYLLYRIYMSCLKFRNRKGFYVFNICESILFSFFLILGAQLDVLTDFQFSLFWGVVILCLACAIYPILSNLTLYLDKYNSNEIKIETESNKRIVIICMGIIVIVWFLAYLAMFPGVYGVDAHTWHFQYSRQDIPISSQWSVIYSGIFYCFVEFGYQYFGNYEIGFGVFSFIQMSIILWVIWNILEFLRSTINYYAVIIATVFFTFVPSHVVLSVSSVQDALFSAFFAMCIIHLFWLSKDAHKYFEKKSNCIKFMIYLLLMCIIRNNGLYAIIVLSFFIIIFLRKYKAYTVLILGTTIALTLIYQGPVYSALGIQKGTAIREMLSLPLQQMAYVYYYESENLSDEVKKQMLEYISDEGWKSYQCCISDQVKNRLNVEYTKDNFYNFITLYFKVGLESPKGFIKGALLQTFGLWYPDKIYPDYRIWHPYLNYLCFDSKGVYDSDFTISRKSILPVYDTFLSWLLGKGDDYSGYGGNLSMAFTKIPLISLCIKSGIYSWLIIYIVGYFIYKRWREPFIVIGFVIGIWITVLLSPVILYRYMAPIIFSAPVFSCTVLGKWDEI